MHGCFEKRTYSRYSFLDGQIEVVLDSEENCPYTNLASHCGRVCIVLRFHGGQRDFGLNIGWEYF